MGKKKIYVAGRVVELTGSNKVMFPDNGITRGDVMDYYRRVASVMLPHLQDRPMVLEFFPEGLDSPAIWQSEIPDDFPEWITRANISQGQKNFVQCICNEPATLVWLADQGSLTFYPWLSRIDLPNQPDRLVFDLEPGDDRFDKMVLVAQELRDFLKQFDLMAYAMTTGSHGLYVVVPLDRSEHFDVVAEFARDVAQIVADENPTLITRESQKELREGKVYIDTNRNTFGEIMVAPYCVRGIESAPVARPIFWNELDDPNFNPKIYEMKNVSLWLDPKSDPWSGMARRARSLREPRQSINAILAHSR